MLPPFANGSETSATSGSAATLSSAPWIACLLAGSRSVPWSTLYTSCASPPANAGLCALKRSTAFWDSAPGTEKSSAALPPAAAAAATRTSTAIATTRLRFQWVVRDRASRASRCDILWSVSFDVRFEGGKLTDHAKCLSMQSYAEDNF